MMIDSLISGYMRYAVRRHMNMRWTEQPFCPRPNGTRQRLLYIHIPFCETLCPYCSFHRIRFEPELAIRYFQILRDEIRIYRHLGFHFSDVYVGGGTPTVMPSEVASLIGFIRSLWPIKRVSVEAHPQHLTPETIAVLKGAGIDRLSVGVQTFHDGLLEKLSRHNGASAGRQARERLQRVKGQFDTVNVDMIYNFPEQTAERVQEDVRILRELEMDQLTFYPLMAGGADFRRIFGKVNARREKELFAHIVEALGESYEPVSGWCFARRRGMQDEYIVAHDEYAGLGSGAFGYVNGVLYANSFDVSRYMDAVARAELPIVAVSEFPEGARLQYDLLMGLFSGSLDPSDLAAKYGSRLAPRFWPELLFLRLVGALVRRGRRYYPTPRGRYYLVILMREFFSGANRLRSFLTVGPPAPAMVRFLPATGLLSEPPARASARIHDVVPGTARPQARMDASPAADDPGQEVLLERHSRGVTPTFCLNRRAK